MSLFNQQPNGMDNRRSINTKGFQFYNADGFGNSTLKLDLWNDAFISIKIHPAKAKNEQTEREKFDYERVMSTALSVNKACELLDDVPRIVKAFDPTAIASYEWAITDKQTFKAALGYHYSLYSNSALTSNISSFLFIFIVLL